MAGWAATISEGPEWGGGSDRHEDAELRRELREDADALEAERGEANVWQQPRNTEADLQP